MPSPLVLMVACDAINKGNKGSGLEYEDHQVYTSQSQKYPSHESYDYHFDLSTGKYNINQIVPENNIDQNCENLGDQKSVKRQSMTRKVPKLDLPNQS